MAVTRQASFAAGELAPTLYGRSDLPHYAAGLRRCKNFFISKHGAAISRPGTVHVADAKKMFADSTGTIRLIPFVYSDSDSFVLEFGGGPTGGAAGYLRFHKRGQPVLSGGAPYEITTPYVEAQARQLRFTQVGNYMVVTHPSHPPYQLIRRTSDINWTFTPISFNAREFESPSVPGIKEPLPTPTADFPAREWQYLITVLEEEADGLVWESKPFTVTHSTNGSPLPTPGARTYNPLPVSDGNAPLVAVYNENGFTVDLDWRSNGLFGPTANLIAYRIYRGRGALFGLIGETKGNKFTDYGHEPNYAVQPPQGRNPFRRRDENGQLLPAEPPTAVGFFESRIVYGGTPTRPGTVFLSRVDDYTNFDKRIAPPQQDEDAFEIILASRKREQIRAVLGLERLLVFTDAAVWALGGDGPITPTDFAARVQSEIGCSNRPPLVVNGSVLYARTKGTGVQDLFYDENRRGYTGRDLSFLAQHLFDGHTIRDWCYAEDPWGVVWVVRSDGALLSLTYVPEQGMWSWAQHETDGNVEAICSVPEGTEDAVYLLVRRVFDSTPTWSVERMASRVVGDMHDFVGLDCARVRTFSTPQPAFAGMLPLRGKTLVALADGKVIRNLTVDALGNVMLPEPARKVIIGIPFVCEIETLDVAEARIQQKIAKRVVWEVEASRGLWTGSGAGLWAGEQADQTTEWQQRIIADDYNAPPLHTGLVDKTVAGRWAKHGRAVLQQRDPLPLTVLGVSREVAVGG